MGEAWTGPNRRRNVRENGVRVHPAVTFSPLRPASHASEVSSIRRFYYYMTLVLLQSTALVLYKLRDLYVA